MLQRAQMTDGGLAFWVVSPGNDALWGAAASLSSRCWAGRRIHLQLLPHVTAKPLSSSPRAWTNALTLHFPLTKRDIYWRQRLVFSIFLLLLNRHQHQEQNWAGWLFTFRICTLTSRLCFMSKKKKKMPIVLADSASNVRVWKEGAGFGKFQSLFLKFIFVLFYPKLFIKKNWNGFRLCFSACSEDLRLKLEQTWAPNLIRAKQSWALNCYHLYEKRRDHFSGTD